MSIRKLNKDDFTIGKEVAMRYQGNRARYEKQGEYGYTTGLVEKIGKKYITVNGIQFNLETGYNKTNYSADYQLFETEDVLVNQINREKAIGKLRSIFSYTSNNENITNDQLFEVIKILNL